MDRLTKTFATALTGTTAMTAASALMSLLPGEEFREPDQLSKLIGRLVPRLPGYSKTIAGWGGHYAMGFVFSAVYVELWEKRKIKHSITNGIILGIVSGILGMLIWKASFKIHPLPPNNNKLDFFLQRIPAHIIFAVFATIGYSKAIQLQKANVNKQKGTKQ